jgi:hypothetical protein
MDLLGTQSSGVTCLRIFLMKVSVHEPWLASCSTISRVNLAFVSLDTRELAWTWLAS